MTIFKTLLTSLMVVSPVLACAAETPGRQEAMAASDAIHVNQLGYLPGSAKLAIVGLPPQGAANRSDRFTVEDAQGRSVLQESCSRPRCGRRPVSRRGWRIFPGCVRPGPIG